MKKSIVDKVNDIKIQKKIIMKIYKTNNDNRLIKLYSDFEKLEYLLINYYKETINSNPSISVEELKKNIDIIFKMVDDAKPFVKELNLNYTK